MKRYYRLADDNGISGYIWCEEAPTKVQKLIDEYKKINDDYTFEETLDYVNSKGVNCGSLKVESLFY